MNATVSELDSMVGSFFRVPMTEVEHNDLLVKCPCSQVSVTANSFSSYRYETSNRSRLKLCN